MSGRGTLDRALALLHSLVHEAVHQAGPGPLDLDVDLPRLASVCHEARALLYKLRGEL